MVQLVTDLARARACSDAASATEDVVGSDCILLKSYSLFAWSYEEAFAPFRIRSEERPMTKQVYGFFIILLLLLTEHHAMKAYWGVEV
jgi:hypothetical protein